MRPDSILNLSRIPERVGHGWCWSDIRLSHKQNRVPSRQFSDGRYAYQLEWINRFQRNSYARLYLKSLPTEEETRIPLDMKVNQIKTITVNTLLDQVRTEIRS